MSRPTFNILISGVGGQGVSGLPLGQVGQDFPLEAGQVSHHAEELRGHRVAFLGKQAAQAVAAPLHLRRRAQRAVSETRRWESWTWQCQGSWPGVQRGELGSRRTWWPVRRETENDMSESSICTPSA